MSTSCTHDTLKKQVDEQRMILKDIQDKINQLNDRDHFNARMMENPIFAAMHKLTTPPTQ